MERERESKEEMSAGLNGGAVGWGCYIYICIWSEDAVVGFAAWIMFANGFIENIMWTLDFL